MMLRPALLALGLILGPLAFLGCGSGASGGTPQITPTAPTAGFSSSPANPTINQSVQFMDTSSGSPAAWAWTFGDGGTSALQNPTHTYAAAGSYTVTLSASNAGGSSSLSRTVTVSPSGSTPVANFGFSPANPVIGQTVSFTDSSSGTPTAWSWTFGDGATSTLQNPTHTYSAAASYTVTLSASNATGSHTTTRSLTVTSGSGGLGAFNGTVVLGSPTATSVKANIFSPDQSGTMVLQYGTVSGTYDRSVPATALVAGTPLVLSLDGLSADARYYYRLVYQAANGVGSGPMAEASFHTARPTGSSFTFTIQADSHMDENSSQPMYLRALGNVLGDGPDFHIDLGDTFMCEKHAEPFSPTAPPAADAAAVETRYRFERVNFGTVSAAVPLFLVNGNHEGEAGWMANGSAQSLAVWTTQARQRHFVNPVPDAFYSGDSQDEPFVGKRASWYAWTWGDALFVVLDPFWNSKKQANQDGWNITLGDRQYQWLQQTLATSSATFKFVFIHNLVGGLDGQMRGGIEAAPFFEWGGKNLDGTEGFATRRPGWALPIHQLLVQNKVTAVFHGHDHLYARQELDGIVYQEVPQPSAVNTQSGPGLATEYHYNSGTILSSSGHLRVSVGPDGVTSRYIRTWLPASETATRKNGEVADAWSVGAPGRPTPNFSYTPTAPLKGQAIAFTDTSTNAPTDWAWSFGDGTSSALQNPSHTYAAPGTYLVSLTVGNALGSTTVAHTLTVAAAAAGPLASFSYTPTAPITGQSVAFKDGSTGTPTSWAWNFGDGSTSSLQNPSHSFAAAGTYIVTLKATNAGGSNSTTRTLTVLGAGGVSAFTGNVVLGCPTATSVRVNVHSAALGGTVYLKYGTSFGALTQQTAQTSLVAATPLELSLEGLSPDTQYYYRLYYQASGANDWGSTEEYHFHTARPAGSTFTFSIQGDSHPERLNSQFDPTLYTRTLLTAAADNPDFYLTIGDDFSVDTLDPTTVTQAQVVERYTIQRPYLGLIGRNAPVFLVNGNHEQAARYLLDGTPNNVAVWAQNARNAHYAQPAPDAFYSGNSEVVPYIGLLRNHYAWTWGDALFVVIDPYWGSPVCVDNPFYGGTKRSNLWEVTHGDAQYQWLKGVLEQSTAKYKFVFAHHVMGTGRGGTELARLYEWGGYNGNGTTWGFTTSRPTWPSTIHQLMVANKVNIFFQGHDHIWVRQQLDGVTYQTLPEPADPTYTLWNTDAFLSGDKFPNTGYTRVTVSPTGVKVDYVRTYLPADEGPDRVNGSVAFSYSLP